MNATLARLSLTLSQTLSRVLLFYGQTPKGIHHIALAVWLTCIVALVLTFSIWPAQDRIQNLEATLHARALDLRNLDERLREAQALNLALTQRLQDTNGPGTAATVSPHTSQDPWPILQGLAHARSVQIIDYAPLSAPQATQTTSTGRDCQPLRVKMLGTSIAVQGLLQDLLRSPQTLERFTLAPDENGSTTPVSTTLALQVCIRAAKSSPGVFPPPSIALFQPSPKVARKPKTALEEFPLSAYRVIAVGRADHDHYALLRTPTGVTHTVRSGMLLGDRGGQVLAITPNGIEVQQDNDRQSLLIGSPP